MRLSPMMTECSTLDLVMVTPSPMAVKGPMRESEMTVPLPMMTGPRTLDRSMRAPFSRRTRPMI